MEVLYHSSQKLVRDIHDLLPHIDRNVGKDADAIERTVLGKLEEITRYDDKYYLYFKLMRNILNFLKLLQQHSEIRHSCQQRAAS